MDERIANGFKETEIGPMPADWKTRTIGDLVDSGLLALKNGFPCGDHNQSGIGIPHLRPFNVDADGNISLGTIKFVQIDKNVTQYLLRAGDVIFNNTNSEELVGKTACWDREGNYTLSNHMTMLRILKPTKLDGCFLATFLHKQWYDGLYRSICRRHVNQASISLARLRDIPIPLPPLDEQQRIAHVLSTVQRAREATDRIIAAARELKRSLMRHLFTYGPVPLDQIDQVPLQETEIGPIPADWKVVRLVQLGTEFFSGGTPSTRQEGYWNGDIPWTTSAYIQETLYLATAPRHITTEGLKNSSSKVVPSQNLLIGTRVGVGKVAINLIDVAISQDLTGMVVDKRKVDLRFLVYIIRSESVQRAFKECSRGTTIKGIPREDLFKIPVPLPPLDEQQRIAHILSVVDNAAAAEENRKAALNALFKSLLSQLMTGQVRV